MSEGERSRQAACVGGVMKLGFVKAVTTAINVDLDEHYGIWLFGSYGYQHTPQYSSYKNKFRHIDYDDYYEMRCRMVAGRKG